MTSLIGYFQELSPTLPPLIALLTILFQREIRFRDLRGSSFSRKHFLDILANENRDFLAFLNVFRSGEEGGDFDFLIYLPSLPVFILAMYYVILNINTAYVLFYFMSLGMILLISPINSLGASIKPKFVKNEPIKIEGNPTTLPGLASYAGKMWNLDDRSKLKFKLILGLYGIPYSVALVVFLRTIYSLLIYIIIPMTALFSELIFYAVVSVSMLVVLLVFRNKFTNFIAELENRLFINFQDQVMHNELELRIYLGTSKGSVLEIRGTLKGISKMCKIMDNDGFSHTIEWKDISNIGIKK